MPIGINKTTARRFVLGRQGLWPGRRWSGKAGTAKALLSIEALQLDPLNVIARSHDLVLMSRVLNYHSEYLGHLVYNERRFFDYGGTIFVYPMAELSYWRLHMRRRKQDERWSNYYRQHAALLDEVRNELHQRGPLGNRDFNGHSRINSYRGRKDTSLALFAMWLAGELMIHHRQGFERVYDFAANVIPQDVERDVTEAEAEHYFARKAIVHHGLISERGWKNSYSGYIHRRISQEEAQEKLEQMLADELIAQLQVDDSEERWLVLAEDLPILSTLEAGRYPDDWQPLQTTTLQEVTFLAPLDIVSARGRAKRLFDFDYVWEVYKPADQRRWGYYVLPILYGDRLVARLDPRLERKTEVLEIKGFWLENQKLAKDDAFISALVNGLVRFSGSLGAGRLDLRGIAPSSLLAKIRKSLVSEVEVEG